MGFSKPQEGETKLFGKDTFDKYHEILNKVGYIPGEIALPQGLTGIAFLRMMQDLQKIHNEERLQELLKLFELDDVTLKGETKRMSLGIKRKLAIVAAFMSDPEVLILDEPTSGLDPVMQEVFIEFVKKEKERGKTILLSSHIFTEVDATCDRIAIIKDGAIVSEFIANDLKHAKTKFYEIIFNTKAECKKFIKDNKSSKVLKIMSDREDSVIISTNDDDINEVVDILARYNIKEFTNLKETLEDYFMKFYKEDKDFGGV